MLRTLRPSGSAAQQASADRQAYLPPNIEKAMQDHMQRSMPEHLKKYQGGDTYVPQRVEREMTQHLQEKLPPHLQQYAGAYVQQQIVQPSLSQLAPAQPAVQTFSPTPQSASYFVRQKDVPEFQPSAPTANNTPQFQAPEQPAPQPEGLDPKRTAEDQPYAFITNPAAAPRKSPMEMLPGGNSVVSRVLIVGGGLIVLLILFGIIKSVLFKGPDFTPYVSVAQEQQELLHITDAASKQTNVNMSANTQYLLATMNASLNSSQAKLITYLSTQHQKITPKKLNLKVSATTDTQLTAAAASATYEATLIQVLQSQLGTYGTSLDQAYKLSSGKNGKALLADDYAQLKLFQVSISSATAP